MGIRAHLPQDPVGSALEQALEIVEGIQHIAYVANAEHVVSGSNLSWLSIERIHSLETLVIGIEVRLRRISLNAGG